MGPGTSKLMTVELLQTFNGKNGLIPNIPSHSL